MLFDLSWGKKKLHCILAGKKAFSLIELLVVLVLIGIVGMVAIPNVKDFFVERELRAAVFKIASIVNGLKSELDSSKSDPTTNLNYEMAQILMGSDNNGFFINTKLRDSEKFKVLCAFVQRECSAARGILPPFCAQYCILSREVLAQVYRR